MDSRRVTSNRYSTLLGNIHPMPIAYHIMLPTHQRTKFFGAESNCNDLAYLLFETSALHGFSLFAFCIMPDHVHILCQPGDIMVNHFINLIRMRYEYLMARGGNNSPIWQPDFLERPLIDTEVVPTAVFIFENPKRAGIIEDAYAYPFSYIYGGKKYRP
ncbi:MAG TPA: transposase [Candidatus Aquicultor sp.]|jgi:putative transposase